MFLMKDDFMINSTGKRRKAKRRKTSSATGKTARAGSTGVRRRKRRVRKTNSRKKLVSVSSTLVLRFMILF